MAATCRSCMRRTGLEPMLAARITQDVLEVLDHAHNFSTTLDGRSIRGVVHGDLKPRNIRLTPAGEVKVLDFGIAKGDFADAQLHAEYFWQCAILLATAAAHWRSGRRCGSLGCRRDAVRNACGASVLPGRERLEAGAHDPRLRLRAAVTRSVATDPPQHSPASTPS